MGPRWQHVSGPVWLVVLTWFCLTASATAQYQVFVWENLESGVFPDSLARMHAGSVNSVALADFAGGTDLPAGIHDGTAAVECGRYGLRFSTGGKENILSAVSSLTLERAKLGDSGRALYQADFWIPPEGESTPNIAVLAMSQASGTSKDLWTVYRFGLSGGTGKSVFFSYMTAGAEPAIKHEEPVADVIGVRPGWHRFQVIFEGQEKIICAIDGKPTKFSPILEGSLKSLRPGVMVAALATKPGICYADNISIQWSPEEVPLPDSPWTHQGSGAPDQPLRTDPAPPIAGPDGRPLVAIGRAPAATGMGTGATTTGGGPAGQPGGVLPAAAPPAAGAGPVWLSAPADAWQRCVAENKPVLLLLFAPRAAGYQRLHEMFRAQPAAPATLNRFIPLAVDVNQLSGGVLAQKFNVFRVPCLIVFGVDGRERARVVVEPSTDWPAIETALRNAAP